MRRRFLDPEAFGRLLGRRSVSTDHLVIPYGDRNNWFAAYAYCYLKCYGHSAVKLLNGPRALWMSQGRPTSAELPDHAHCSYQAGRGDSRIRITRDEVLNALDDGHAFVDVRSPSEYAGAECCRARAPLESRSARDTYRARARSRGRSL